LRFPFVYVASMEEEQTQIDVWGLTYMKIEKYIGDAVEWSLAGDEREAEYTEVEDKAFLSNKSIRRLILPKNIERIGNWAFAHMHLLERIEIPKNNITLGKQCFLDCQKLREIVVTGDDSENPGNAFFLYSVVSILQKPLLFLPEEIGSKEKHAAFMKNYDAAVSAFLKAPDDDGYEPFFLGWFNDEDADGVQKPRYEKQRREEKMLLARQRLRYSMALSEEGRKELTMYLTEHFEQVLLSMYSEHFGADVEYVKVLEVAGLLTEENRNKLVELLSPGDPEVMAYLLRQGDSETDAFDRFLL